MTIEGVVAPGYETVREAFAENFTGNSDIGAAVAVYRDGEPVVDLWGGSADTERDRPWQRDTVTLVYSATKGVLAVAAHLLAQRGELDLDAPVIEYWPEFGAAGKQRIPVRWLLSHRAGLPALDRPVPVADTLNWDPMVDALAAQRPLWEPGSAHGYHGRTFGWLVGEVVRRVSGRSPGQFVAEEIAAPLGADFFIGLPDAERDRVARLAFTPPPDFAALDIDSVPEEMRPMVAAAKDPNSLYHRAFQVTDPPDMDFNSVEVQAAQIPSSNGIGTARGLARIYASLIGEVDGVRLLNSETRAAATREQSAGTDRVLAMPTRFGSGFMLPTPTMPLTGPTTFGHPGRGGSLAFADPDRGLAFAYVTDHIIEGALDTRASSLLAAIPS